MDSICILPSQPGGQNYCSHQCLHWWQELSTGQFHENGFESLVCARIKKNTTRLGGVFFGGDYWTRTIDLLRVKQAL